MATIRCTVDNCFYWARDNYCGADTILITSNQAAERYPEGVDAPQTSLIVNDIGETPAESCQETACKTFKNQKNHH